MSIVTPTELGQYIGVTLNGAEQLQAGFAIDQAVSTVSGLLCFDIDPSVPATSAVPPALSAIGAGSCGTITAGKFKVFSITNLQRLRLAPFTAIRQVIVAPLGRNFTGTNTCTAGLSFFEAWQYSKVFNGNANGSVFNQLELCTGHCFPSACMDCQAVYVDADWGWEATVGEGEEAETVSYLPAAIKGMVLEVAKDIMAQAGNDGLKSENIDGHSYTVQDARDYKKQFAEIIRQYGACGFNIL